MERLPQEKRLEYLLRSSKIVADGFLGDDPRSPEQIMETDLAALTHSGYAPEQVAARMQELTALAVPRLGNPVRVGDRLEVVSVDYKGRIICPWPHPVRLAKRITTARRLDTDESVRWTDLNIHMIAEHGFFEGRGAAFRIEPAVLVRVIFGDSAGPV
jgi:hypothetical protein